MYPHYHTYISTSSNTCIHFIEYVYSHHRTRISLPHFVGIYVYAGTINRSPTAADGLQQRCERIAKHCWRSAKTLQNTLHHSALRTTMPQHTNIKKRIKFTTEYEKNNTNGKHLYPHFPTLICAKTPFTIEQPILVRHIHTVWRGVHRPNFNHNKGI